MNIENDPIFMWLAQFAFQPGYVYMAVVGMMALSAIGLPLPEEVTLISVGILAYMGANPDLYPPPYAGAPFVHTSTAALVAFAAVFFADTLIYFIGRTFGRKLLNKPRVQKLIKPEMMNRVEEWTKKYGSWACGIFRFTPGIRFPGHLACGILRFPIWKFLLIDGIAALISVPTQIYLIAKFGDEILVRLRQGKLIILVLILIAITYFAVKKWREKKSLPQS